MSFSVQNNTIKSGRPLSDKTSYGDKNLLRSERVLKNLKLVLKRNADGSVPEISKFSLAMSCIERDDATMMCYEFLDGIFKLIGDFTPNNDEIHLESQCKQEVHV